MSILQCLADSLDETIEEHANPDKLWRSLCLASRRILAATYRDRPLQIRTVFRENIGSHTGQGITNRRSFGGASMRHDSTTMIIPATAFVAPIKPDGTKVLTMESFIGGTQLHLMQDGSVAYKLPSCFPPGPFYLTALIVNIHRQQFPLEVSIENGQMRSIYTTSPLLTKIEIEVPYTGGAWLTTKPVKVEIDPGVLLKITRDVSSHGLTIKEFFLQPA